MTSSKHWRKCFSVLCCQTGSGFSFHQEGLISTKTLIFFISFSAVCELLVQVLLGRIWAQTPPILLGLISLRTCQKESCLNMEAFPVRCARRWWRHGLIQPVRPRQSWSCMLSKVFMRVNKACWQLLNSSCQQMQRSLSPRPSERRPSEPGYQATGGQRPWPLCSATRWKEGGKPPRLLITELFTMRKRFISVQRRTKDV